MQAEWVMHLRGPTGGGYVVSMKANDPPPTLMKLECLTCTWRGCHQNAVWFFRPSMYVFLCDNHAAKFSRGLRTMKELSASP